METVTLDLEKLKADVEKVGNSKLSPQERINTWYAIKLSDIAALIRIAEAAQIIEGECCTDEVGWPALETLRKALSVIRPPSPGKEQ